MKGLAGLAAVVLALGCLAAQAMAAPAGTVVRNVATASYVPAPGGPVMRLDSNPVEARNDAALMAVTKSGSFARTAVSGPARIDFSIRAVSIGARDAQPSATVAPDGTPLRVNGVPTALVLVRDALPAGTHYVAGTLRSTTATALRLFRLPGDPPFSYRTTDDAAAIEVAVGVPSALPGKAALEMQFAATADAAAAGEIRNTAQADYHDGAQAVESPSNTLVLGTGAARFGVAKSATLLRGMTAADGIVTARFSLHVRNYGTVALYGLQLRDALEGGEATRFGRYTAAAAPGPNEYTLVPGSLKLAEPAAGGTVIAVDNAFTGAAGARRLLAPAAVLPVGARFTVQFDVRVNLSGRSDVLLNTVRAQAALAPGAEAVVFDDSVNGTDPDADGDGNPNNDGSPTPLAALLPAQLAVSKKASAPRTVAPGVHDIDYRVQVRNTGATPATHVRLIDNLDCAFEMDRSDGTVASWTLTAPPRARRGLLKPAASFTGHAPCDREGLVREAPQRVPAVPALRLVEGNDTLAPGQSEEIVFTVRVVDKPGKARRSAPVNKAWAVSLSENAIAMTPAVQQAADESAVADSVQSLIADPQGTVYNAVTRQPVAGAVVTFRRASCGSGTGGPISADQIHDAASGAYTFQADGSVSMTTGADGSYQFFLLSPSVAGLCSYALDVTPPAGSGYVYPSQLLPATGGSFGACSAVVPNAAAPQGSEPTTHYRLVDAGFDAAGAACDVVHNHIPLDPGNVLGLVLRKDGSKRQAELGDFVDYALTVTNKTGFAVQGLSLVDALPPGFAYVAGSARLDGAAAANPLGGAGPQLRFDHPALALGVDQSVTLRYRLRIGVGAPTNGEAVNRARASSGPIQSNLASWRTRVTGGVFADDAFLFGKVFLDCRRDGVQEGGDELGVPGVRLLLEDGTSVISDVEGKWSIYGLKPLTHVLRLDATTLPAGAVLDVLDHRNAGNPGSRFVDLRKGEFHKANFPIGNCDAGVVAGVAARRAAIAAQPDTEAEAQVRAQLDPEGRSVMPGDLRSLPASGLSLAGGASGAAQATSAPLIAMPAAAGEGGGFVGGVSGGGTLGVAPAAPLASPMPVGPPIALPRAAPSPIALETLLPQLTDGTLAFIDLKDGDTLAGQSVNIRVKGEPGLALRLTVNGEVIEQTRVGKKAQLASKNLSAWEYIGVLLRPGENRLALKGVDAFGNARGIEQRIAVIAPDRLGTVEVEAPASAQADALTPIVVRVRLTDAAGVPVTARTQLTLETDRGRWLADDLNTLDPGTQVFMDNGSAEFRLLPPGEPGNARLRVSAGGFVKEVRMAMLPALRPMIGVGIVEGVLDLSRRGATPLGAQAPGAAFEAELTGLSGEGSGHRAGARAAFFFKGAVKGEYLLTAAYDSDKAQRDRLFRDIRPDEFYPIYGDSSVKGFDAQSTQKLYVRIDKDRSYLLYGDFITASSTEVRSLSQSNRALTGLKHVHESDGVRATSYVSRTAQTQQVEEFRALGTSGPYYLRASAGELVDNSEQIEVMVRDRNQPDIVLQRTPVTRFVDYTVEPLTRRILFTHAIASVDANLNPQSIRIAYEVDSGGPKFTVAGTDVQVKVAQSLQLGVVASTDENPQNRRTLAAFTGVARLGDHTTMAAELVRTESGDKGKGEGGRIELRHQTQDLAVVALANKTTAGFDNPGASFSAGRTEATARAEYKLDTTTALRAEALYGKDALLDGDRKGISASVQKKLGDALVGELGLRWGQGRAGLGAGTGFDYGQISTYDARLGGGVGAGSVTPLGAAADANAHADALTTVRARLSAPLPGLPLAQVFVEGEQDLRHSDRHALAIGGNYALSDRTRLYGRYELISSLYGPYALNSAQSNNVGILGIESNYMEGGRVYNEYRLADSIDGRGGQAALGVRNTFKLSERLSVTGGIEHTRRLGGYDNSVNHGTGYGGGALGQSVAVTGGAEYLAERFKTSGIVEMRTGDDSHTRLFSAGLGYRIDAAWSLLARSVISDSAGQGANAGNERHLQRHQIGLALRPVDTDTWNALMRYERRTERVVGAGDAPGAFDGGNVFGSAALPGRTGADIVSAHLSYNLRPGTTVNARYAFKHSFTEDTALRSTYWAHLVQARYTQDVGQDWDFGLQAGFLFGKGGALQRTTGIEVGYQVAKDLWVSAGYNFVGLTDRDLTANEYTAKGAYLRVRFKFDETRLGFAPSAAAAAAAMGAR